MIEYAPALTSVILFPTMLAQVNTRLVDWHPLEPRLACNSLHHRPKVNRTARWTSLAIFFRPRPRFRHLFGPPSDCGEKPKGLYCTTVQSSEPARMSAHASSASNPAAYLVPALNSTATRCTGSSNCRYATAYPAPESGPSRTLSLPAPALLSRDSVRWRPARARARPTPYVALPWVPVGQ